ncbi:MAG: sensor histidine kinase [Cellvibrionaceae bacterium]
MSIEANVSGHLRNKLFAFLSIPMLLVSLIFITETYISSKKIAKESFDKSLTILTLAIMGQSENLSGDSLSEYTLELINGSIGDIFYYSVVAPDGGYITGYSNRPEMKKKVQKKETGKPILFNSTYQETPVRVAFFKQNVNNENYGGWIELTVWQYLDKQHELQELLFIRSVSRLSILVILVGIILWFGIQHGLTPLSNLQRSIERRSINDLNPIKSAVPFEVAKLVGSMNDLFSRLRTAIVRREAFLGNASHQLKTPLARIQAQAELAVRENGIDNKLQHINSIIKLTKQSSRLTNQMLSLLRAESDDLLFKEREDIELNQLARQVAEHYALDITRSNRELIFQAYNEEIFISALPIMLTEAISNLVENAIAYSHKNEDITIHINKNEHAEIRIIDRGPGVLPEERESVMRRFYRKPGTKADGCGLGLPIVNEIASSFNGELFFEGPEKRNGEFYFSIGMRFPIITR